jgi:uncharacterized pyridoxal phosphate-containing UPF0001 family protein
VTDLQGRVDEVFGRIADAARSAERDPASLTTIVVTKFHPEALVRELYGLGLRDVGENRHQEAQAKAAATAVLDGFVQINLTDDPARGGIQPGALEPLVERILATDGLTLRGVMAVAPRDDEPRPAFARLRELSDRVRALHPSADRISAGMSHDFAEAIAEGATHLRIGTAITGNRPDAR